MTYLHRLCPWSHLVGGLRGYNRAIFQPYNWKLSLCTVPTGGRRRVWQKIGPGLPNLPTAHTQTVGPYSADCGGAARFDWCWDYQTQTGQSCQLRAALLPSQVRCRISELLQNTGLKESCCQIIPTQLSVARLGQQAARRQLISQQGEQLQLLLGLQCVHLAEITVTISSACRQQMVLGIQGAPIRFTHRKMYLLASFF